MTSILSLLFLLATDLDSTELDPLEPESTEMEVARLIQAKCQYEQLGKVCCIQCFNVDEPSCGTVGLCAQYINPGKCQVAPIGWETTCVLGPKRGFMTCRDENHWPFRAFYRCNPITR